MLTTGKNYVICTRSEYAGALSERDDGGFLHLLYGDCKCGIEHNAARPLLNGHKKDYFLYEDPRATNYFHYYDEQGQWLFDTVRYEWADPSNLKGHNKTCRAWSKDQGQWTQKIQGIRRVLYRLPELLQAAPEQRVYIPEGENKVEALRQLGFIATCNPFGAKKWDHSYSAFLKGRSVVLLPDNDADGREHVKRVASSLAGVAASVQVVTLPDLPEKGDVIDWLAAGGTREQLDALATSQCVDPGVFFSDIQEEELLWFWDKWIPRGKITMIDAMPDQGKSLLCTELAACTTNHKALPDKTLCSQGNVILVDIEDTASDTVKPRLLAAGANPGKVLDLSKIRYRNEHGDIDSRSFMIPRDLPVLEEQIIRHNVVLVCLDPLMAILDAKLKSQNDQDVRQALTPLANLLERTKCACVIVRHFNKGNSSNAIIRGAGSMGIIGASRSQLFIVQDPDNEEQHILALGKHNLSTGAPNLVYSIVPDTYNRPKIEWKGISLHSTAELLSPVLDKPSASRQEVLAIFKAATEPLSPLDIAEQSGNITHDQAKQLVRRMAKSGEIESVAYGKYTLPSQNTVTPVTPVTLHTLVTPVTLHNNNNNNKVLKSDNSDNSDRVTGDFIVTEHEHEPFSFATPTSNGHQSARQPSSFQVNQVIRYHGKPQTVFLVKPDEILVEDKDRRVTRIGKEFFGEIKA